jgi:transcriptional regulator with XRE-family HTH domain
MARTNIDVTALYAALDAARTSKGMSWRHLAREVQVSPSTMSRLANGLNPDVNAFAAMVRWLNMPAEKFMVDEDEAGTAPREREQPDLLAELAPLLRARKDLDAEDVRHLEELIGSAVKRFNADRQSHTR